MGEMTPALLAALQGDRPLVFGAVEINLPGHDVRLLDGSAEVTIGGNVFRGKDDTFGVLASVKEISDGIGDEAPVMSITLLPPDDSSAVTLASAAMQGSPVRAWLGVLDMGTGLPVPDPLLLFAGEVDVPTIKWTMRGREVEYRCGSVFDRFFDLEEGIRLSDSHHQNIWGGELGLKFVTGVTKAVYWGTENVGAVQNVTTNPLIASTKGYTLI